MLFADLQSSAEAAIARYHETAALCRTKLDAYRSEAAAEVVASADPDADRSAGAAARLGRLSWIACMLLSTSEEALRTSHARCPS